MKGELSGLWKKFVESFVGAAATALLVGAGALITGIYERIHMIDTIAANQVKFDQRLDTLAKAVQEGDNRLGERVAVFSSEHIAIKDEVKRIGNIMDGRRSSGPIR